MHSSLQSRFNRYQPPYHRFCEWTVRGLQYNIEDLIFIYQPTPSQLSAFFNLWEQAMSLSREVTAKKIKKSARAQHKYDDE